jgi:hypothetical protein
MQKHLKFGGNESGDFLIRINCANPSFMVLLASIIELLIHLLSVVLDVLPLCLISLCSLGEILVRQCSSFLQSCDNLPNPLLTIIVFQGISDCFAGSRNTPTLGDEVGFVV